jgi:hypothetical protein
MYYKGLVISLQKDPFRFGFVLKGSNEISHPECGKKHPFIE